MTEEKFIRGFVRRLRMVRGERTLREFAKRLDTFEQNTSRWEQGTLPTPAMLVKLARRENVNLNWLLLGVGDRNRN